MSDPTETAADLIRLLDAVNDEASFIRFVGEIARDFSLERKLEAAKPSPPYGAGRLGWENGTIDAMLESAEAWGIATSKSWTDSTDQNVWRRCAHILLAGKFYE